MVTGYTSQIASWSLFLGIYFSNWVFAYNASSKGRFHLINPYLTQFQTFRFFGLLPHSQSSSNEKAQCVKNIRIRCYSCLHFPAFGLNTERYRLYKYRDTEYSVSLRIQSDCGEMRTRITPNTDIFYAVTMKRKINLWIFFCLFLHCFLLLFFLLLGGEQNCEEADIRRHSLVFHFVRDLPLLGIENCWTTLSPFCLMRVTLSIFFIAFYT